MYSLEQRKLAVETLIKFDHSYADTIAELGYPNRHSLYNWWKDYQEYGEVRPGKPIRQPKFTPEMKQAAVEHYLEHGKSLARTMRALGYPKSKEYLASWIDELAPGQGIRGVAPNSRKRATVPDPGRRPVLTWCAATSSPRSRRPCCAATSSTSRPARDGCTWRRSSTCARAWWSDGRSPSA